MPHIDKQMLSFFLTTKCNLCCIYCYNAKERKSIIEQTLPLHIAKAGVDYYFKNCASRHIRFYGPGEPTQEFELMRAITEYAKSVSANNKVTVEIQTNGIFNSSVCSWVLENVNIVWMSFDGPPDIQNLNRPLNPLYSNAYGGHSSAEILENNVVRLTSQKEKRDIMIGARVTITNGNITRQKEMVDYFYNLGIKYIWTDPLFPSVDKIPVCDDWKKQDAFYFDIQTYIDNYIDAYYYANSKNVFYGSFFACNFDGETNRHCRACTPTPHITPDGYISACDMVTFGHDAHHMDCFVYGKWNNENQEFVFDNRKITHLQERTIENMEHCKNCEVNLYCGGYCLGEIANETGSIYGCKPSICKAIRKLYQAIGSYSVKYKYLHP